MDEVYIKNAQAIKQSLENLDKKIDQLGQQMSALAGITAQLQAEANSSKIMLARLMGNGST